MTFLPVWLGIREIEFTQTMYSNRDCNPSWCYDGRVRQHMLMDYHVLFGCPHCRLDAHSRLASALEKINNKITCLRYPVSMILVWIVDSVLVTSFLADRSNLTAYLVHGHEILCRCRRLLSPFTAKPESLSKNGQALRPIITSCALSQK